MDLLKDGKAADPFPPHPASDDSVSADTRLFHAPTVQPTTVVTPPATESDLAQLACIIVQLTLWLHQVLGAVDEETKKLCRAVAAMRALERLTLAMARKVDKPGLGQALAAVLDTDDSPPTTRLCVASRVLLAGALKKFGKSQGRPSARAVDAKLDDACKGTYDALWGIVNRPNEKLSALIPESYGGIRNTYASVMDKSVTDIVWAYYTDKTQQLEVRLSGVKVFTEVVVIPCFEELAKTEKFGELSKLADDASEHPETKKSLLHVIFQSAGEAGLKAVGPEGLALSMLKVVSLARLSEAAANPASGKALADSLFKRLCACLHLDQEAGLELVKRYKAVTTAQSELVKAMKSVKDTKIAAQLTLDLLDVRVEARELHDFFKATKTEGTLEFFQEGVHDGPWVNSALTVFAALQLYEVWQELGEPAASPAQYAERLVSFTTGALEGAAALAKVTSVLGEKIDIRLTRDLLPHLAADLGEGVARAVPILTMLMGGLEMIDGIDKGDTEKTALGSVTVGSGFALWAGMACVGEETLLGLTAAAWTGIGDLLIIGMAAYLTLKAIREAGKPGTQMTVEQLIAGLERKESWAGQSYVSILGLDSTFDEVKLRAAAIAQWRPIIADDGTEQANIIKDLEEGGFSNDVAKELVKTPADFDWHKTGPSPEMPRPGM
jgi:hypothetical protein